MHNTKEFADMCYDALNDKERIPIYRFEQSNSSILII